MTKYKVPDFVQQFSELGDKDLREECQKRGIKWRDAAGRGHHLNTKSMVKTLAAFAKIQYKAERRYAR